MCRLTYGFMPFVSAINFYGIFFSDDVAAAAPKYNLSLDAFFRFGEMRRPSARSINVATAKKRPCRLVARPFKFVCRTHAFSPSAWTPSTTALNGCSR